MLIFTQPKGHTKGQKTFFFVKICYKSCIIKNRSQMYTSEKNTKQLTVRGGGGNPYGQPDRKISGFFFDGFPNYIVKWISLVQLLRSAVQVMTFLHCVFSNVSSTIRSAIVLCSTFSWRRMAALQCTSHEKVRLTSRISKSVHKYCEDPEKYFVPSTTGSSRKNVKSN